MCVGLLTCLCVCGGWGREAVVLLVIMKERGIPLSGLSEKDGWFWAGGVRTEWLAQGNSPNVGLGERPQSRSGAKTGWGEVEPFLLGWDPREQGYEPDPGW